MRRSLLSATPETGFILAVPANYLSPGCLVRFSQGYLPRPWSYWLAPVADLPAALNLIQSALKQHHCWHAEPTSMQVAAHSAPRKSPKELLPFKAGFAAIAAATEKRLHARLPIIPAGLRYKES